MNEPLIANLFRFRDQGYLRINYIDTIIYYRAVDSGWELFANEEVEAYLENLFKRGEQDARSA
jgi:hypothetical protein